MPVPNRFLLVLATASVLSGPAAASTLHPPQFPSDAVIQRVLDERVEAGGAVGLVVGLLEMDGTTRVFTAGSAGDGAHPLGPTSVFQIGSISKVLTGTLLADMVRRGEASLNDPVADYLPEGLSGGTRATLADLATHRAGLPHDPDDLPVTDLSDGLSAEDDERRILHSRALSEDRAFVVALPRSYHERAHEARDYPVLYILDAERHFRSSSAVVDHMAGEGEVIPEMIVVGVYGQGSRARDLTPTHSRIGSTGVARKHLEVSGGADAFLTFLRHELIPEIDRRYRTRPYRVLAGHSLGGLFALHTLTRAPELFDAFLAVDPSLWWDDEVVVDQARTALDRGELDHTALFLASTNTRTPSLPGWETHDDAIGRFAAVVEDHAPRGVRFSHRTFAEEGHASVPLPAVQAGLRHVFDGYWISDAELMGDARAVLQRYRALSDRIGTDLRPREERVQRVAGRLVESGNADAALGLLKLNVWLHPGSFLATRRLAQAFARRGESERAVRHFERALALAPGDPSSLEGLRAARRFLHPRR